MKNVINITVRLFVITVVCAALLGVVFSITKEPIAQQVEKAAAEARFAAFPDAADFAANDTAIPDGYSIIKSVYNAVDKSGNVIGAVFSITTNGYSSGLNMTVGIGSDGVIKGVIIGDNNETQGLGKKAAEPDFYGQFVNKPSGNPFKVVKSSPGDSDIQAISGATITSKAVTNAVNTSIEFYKQLGGVK